jgi:hypothetical protein
LSRTVVARAVLNCNGSSAFVLLAATSSDRPPAAVNLSRLHDTVTIWQAGFYGEDCNLLLTE